MRALSLLLVIGSVFGKPQYNLQNPSVKFPDSLSPCSSGNGGLRCRGGQTERNIYSYEAPAINRPGPPPADIPQPKVRHNIVFIKNSDNQQQQDPIVIPQSQEKTLVYVLSKSQQQQPQQIQFEDEPALKPEVYYVHYGEGDNVDLPGGYDLQSALAFANAEEGRLIEGAGGSGIAFGSGRIRDLGRAPDNASSGLRSDDGGYISTTRKDSPSSSFETAGAALNFGGSTGSGSQYNS